MTTNAATGSRLELTRAQILAYRRTVNELNERLPFNEDSLRRAAYGEVAGTWRRANSDITIQTWRRPSPQERDAIEAEARALPVPGAGRHIAVTWGE
jgi:hypothetical protein